MHFVNLASAIYVGLIKPFKSKLLHRMEFFNEICIGIVYVHFVIFTEWDIKNQSFDVKTNAAYSTMIHIWILILVNMILVGFFTFYDSYLLYVKYKRPC